MIKKSLIYSFLACQLLAVELPTIVVQSSKLDESTLDIPKSIDILDKKKLELFEAKDVQNLSSVVSNTYVSGLGNRSDRTFTVRGIGNYLAYESSVAMYIDDVAVPFSYGYGAVDFNNIQKIEFLKGPQGAEFGKGSESGVINVYTKSPTKEFFSEASIGYGVYNTQDYYAHVSGHIKGSDIGYSIALSKSLSDGYSKNVETGSDLDYRDMINFNAKLEYNPTANFDMSLNYLKNKVDDGGTAFKVNTKLDIRNIYGEKTDDFVKMDNDFLSLKMKYKEEYYKITSITSYAKEKVLKNDYVAISGGLILDFDIDIEEVSQELRVNYMFEDVDLLVGVFYSDKIKFDYIENQQLVALPLASLNSLQNPDENIALFTKAKYYINDNFILMGGLRYQQTKRSFSREMNDFGRPPTYVESATTWTHLLPTASISYMPTEAENLYLTYAKGYKPGGYNYRSSDILVPYEPEIVDSFELGYKREENSNFLFKGVLFYNIITDSRGIEFSDTLATTVVSIDKARSYGAELEVIYSLENLTLDAIIGYTDSEFTKSTSHSNLIGNSNIEIPDITAALGAKYKILHNYYTKANINYIGSRYYNIENTVKEDGYATFNLSAGYESKDLQVKLYADNLFDKEYVDFMISTPSNNYYHFGAPRVIGFNITKKF